MKNSLFYAKYIWTFLFFLIPTIAIAGVISDYNPWAIDIPDAGSSVNSDLDMSGAPEDAVISSIGVYFEIIHSNPGDLDIWLTTYYDGGWHDYFLYHQGDLGSSGDVFEYRSDIHEWDGASPNETWYLVVRDNISGEQGAINFLNYGLPTILMLNRLLQQIYLIFRLIKVKSFRVWIQ